MSKQKVMQDLSERITDIMVQMPQLILDDMVFTFAYSVTAQTFDDNPIHGKRELHARYQERPDLLEPDLNAAPLVKRRLERLIAELPVESTARQLAEKYLPSVIKFGAMLSEYAAARPHRAPDQKIE